MGVNKKDEQRNSVRFFLQLKARYSVEGGGISWGELKPASIRGIVKWMGKEGDHFIGGIEFTEELDEIKWDKLVEPA